MQHTLPPSAEDIAALAEQAVAGIPPRLARFIQNVAISVQDMPDDEMLTELEIDSPYDLTGLYQGTPLIHRSHGDIGRGPDLIHLFREPILLEWIETGEDLGRLVRNVVIHEIAHHFGFSDAEIEALERD